MSDLAEAIAQALHAEMEKRGWAAGKYEVRSLWHDDLAGVVLGVVHEHADIEAAAAVKHELDWRGVRGEGPSFEDCPNHDLHVADMRPVVIAALGGSEKP